VALAVGLDIGLQAIKIAVVDGTAKKPRLKDFIDYRLEAGETTRSLGPDGLAILLRRVFRERKVPEGATLVTAVPAASALTRELQVPFSRDDQIAKTIKFQAESVFPSTPIDDMVVDYYKLEDARPPAAEKKTGGRGGAAEGKSERSRLLVIALRKEVLRQQLGMLAAAEMDPALVDLDAAAIFNAFTATRDAQEGKRTLIIDLGGGSMKVLAVEGGRLRALRSLRAQAGGIKVGEKKQPRLTLEDLKTGLSPEEKDDAFFMEEEGRLPVVILDEEQSEVFDLASESEETRQNVLEKILLEIDRTLAASRLEGPIERVVLTGGGAAAEGIERAFAEHFQAPCERLSFQGAAVAVKGARGADRVDLVGATALGLALKGIGWDKGGLDFRKEEFTFAGKFEKAKRGVACALVLLFVFFFVIAYDYQLVEMTRLYRKQDRILHYQRNIYFTLFPEEDPRKPPQDILVALKLKQREVKGVAADVPEVASALDMLRDTAQGFEEAGKKFTLKQLSYKQRGSDLRGEVDDPGIAYDLKAAVNGKERLVVLQDPKVTPNPQTGKVDVQFRIDLRESDKKKPGAPIPPPRPSSED
jgi:Tfp pilus assembly PilM family ATPase